MSKIYKATTLSPSLGKWILKNHEVPVKSPISEENVEHDKQATYDRMLADSQKKAELLIQQAKEQIVAMQEAEKQKLAAWWEEKQREADRLFEEAKSDGYAEGFQKGESEAVQRVEANYKRLLEEANDVLKEAYEAKEKVIAEAEPFLIQMSVAISEKILQREWQQETAVQSEMVKNIIEKLRDTSSIEISVHPKDFTWFQQRRNELISMMVGKSKLYIYADASCKAGGCIIRTDSGVIDARLDKQLQEVKEQLLKNVRDEEHEVHV